MTSPNPTAPTSADPPWRILAVGAHPDDIEFGCGGILLGEAGRGAVISLVVCSRGESGTNGTPAEREAEARSAAEMLRAALEFLDFGGDAHIEALRAHALTLARCIRAFRPDFLLAPTPTPDQHPDHAVVGGLCRDAARLARYAGIAEMRDLLAHAVGRVYYYAVTPGAGMESGGPGVRVDISAQFARWVELMECHRSQLRTRRYVDLQTTRARLLGLEAGVEYAQSLYYADPWLARSLTELPRSVRLF